MNKRVRLQRPPTAAQPAGPARRMAAAAPSLHAMRAEDVRLLQSAAGNRATRTAAQRSMQVGAAGDAFEREADAVAREVVGQSGASEAAQRMEAEEEELQMSRVQRMEAEEEELQMSRVQRMETEEEELQMSRVQREAVAPEVGMDGGAASAETSAAIESARGGGSPLPGGTRDFMEQQFGADFGAVRVHADAESAALNQRLSARAFTTGTDIFMGSDGFNPGTRGGQELLAHELTHVVQQGGAPAARKTRHTS